MGSKKQISSTETSATNMASLENQLFNLKFTSKQLIRMSKKCEKNEKAQKLKTKQAIEKGNMEGARIYAQNAIREKNQALNYLRLSSRIDAVAARVETAVRMRQVTASMQNIVIGMDKVMQTMDTQKITQIMDKFDQQFEDMDVRATYVENSMNQSATLSTPADQVDLLIQQVADEHGLEVADKLGTSAVPLSRPSAAAAAAAEPAQEDDLAERLMRLKSPS